MAQGERTLRTAWMLQALLVVLLAPPLNSLQPCPSAGTAAPQAFGFAPSRLPDASSTSRPSRPACLPAPSLLRRSHALVAARPMRARQVGPTWKCAASSSDFTIAVSTVMGLESVAKQELQQIGGSGRRFLIMMHSDASRARRYARVEAVCLFAPRKQLGSKDGRIAN